MNTLAFKEDDVDSYEIGGTQHGETCSVSYDDLGRIVLVKFNTTGNTVFYAYVDSAITSDVIRTTFDKDSNWLETVAE